MGAREGQRGRIWRTSKMKQPQEPIELRRQRIGTVLRELARDVAEERRRRRVLEREVRELRARLAAYEGADAGCRGQSGRRV